MLVIPKSWYKYLTAGFFGSLLIIGFLIYKDYGISYDDEYELYTGLVTLKYLVEIFAPGELQKYEWLENIPALANYPDADHGVTVLLPMAIIKAVLNISTFQETFFFRHLFTFLLFYLGVIFFYLLCLDRFRNQVLALLGCLLLVLSPRIFAESFYNSKDIPFLSFFIIATYTLIKFINAPTISRALIHGFACALAIDTRIMGVLLPALTILYILIETFQDHRFLRRNFIALTVYPTALIAFTITLWPYLWEDPVNRFISIFQNMSQFRWTAEVFYLGDFIPAPSLPWHYLSVWIIVTTPVVHIALFIIGVLFLGYRLLRERLINRFDYIYPLIILLPILSVIILNSVVYDGWRHVYFLHFALVMIALIGIEGIWNYSFSSKSQLKFARTALVLLLFIGFSHTSWFMIKNHPYQNVYFSLISGEVAAKNFERDYWGLSYRQALEFILKADKGEILKFNAANPPGRLNTLILSEADKKRLQHVPLDQATYFLTDYRWHPVPYPYPNEIYSKEVEGLKIMSVFKLK